MRTFSLWLTPSSSSAATLTSEISRLSSVYSAPLFPPHVTLLTPAAGATEESCRAASAALAASLPGVLNAQLTGVECGKDTRHWRFRCVFLRLLDESVLHGLHADARARLPPSAPDEGYMPHLSLLYSDIDADARAVARDDAARALAPLDRSVVPLDALELWDTTSAEPTQWMRVERFALGGGAAALV